MSENDVRYPEINVRLAGEDGNAVVIIGRVRGAIFRMRGKEAADAFAREALGAGSYDEVLRICTATVNVT